MDNEEAGVEQAASGTENSCASRRGGAFGAMPLPGEVKPLSGQGAQFIFAAAAVANVLCENLRPTQINLLANFFSVITTCVYAILTVENPSDVLQD